MLQSLFNIKLIALAAALGLNTEDWKNPSKAMVEQVTSLESAMKLIEEGKSADVNKATEVAVTEIKKLADAGDKDAQFAIALLAQGQQNGAAAAMKYYKDAADQGQLQATNNLGFLTMAQAKGMPEAEAKVKVAEGVALIEKAANAGNTPAMRNMAQLYLTGQAGQTKNEAKGVALLEAAAKKDDGQAMYELSQFYGNSANTDKDRDEKAKSWLEQSATGKNPSPNGLDTLGSLYLSGGKIGLIKIDKDEAKAVSLFKTLADEKNPVGLRKMGGLSESEKEVGGVKQDYNAAVKYYQAAARGNDAIAQFRLASMLDQGFAPGATAKDSPEVIKSKIIIQPNDAAALNLYKLAAQNNLPIALYNVGVFYEQGRAVDKDVTKAFAAFLSAAESGVALGMQKAGIYYSQGAGTLKDPIAAAGWFARAAAAKLPEAQLALGQVYEAGVGPADGNANPYLSAATQYNDAVDNPNASTNVQAEALLRLGSLYFRGAPSMTKDNQTPKPNFNNAYIYFKRAALLAPDAPLPKQLMEAAAKELKGNTADGDKVAVELNAKRDATVKAAVEAAQKAAAPPEAAAPGAVVPAGKTPPKPKTVR